VFRLLHDDAFCCKILLFSARVSRGFLSSLSPGTGWSLPNPIVLEGATRPDVVPPAAGELHGFPLFIYRIWSGSRWLSFFSRHLIHQRQAKRGLLPCLLILGKESLHLFFFSLPLMCRIRPSRRKARRRSPLFSRVSPRRAFSFPRSLQQYGVFSFSYGFSPSF